MGVDHGGWIPFQQFAADHQHRFLAGAFERRAMVVVPEIRIERPAMQLRNVVKFFLERGRRQVVGIAGAARVPELAEITAALVRRKFAPQQLAREFVIQTHHIRFDKFLIGLDQRDAVRRNQIDVRQEEFRRDSFQRLVHRQIDFRVSHHLTERIGKEIYNPLRDRDDGEAALGDRNLGIDGRDHFRGEQGQIERDGRGTFGDRAGRDQERERVFQRGLKPDGCRAVGCADRRAHRRTRLGDCEIRTHGKPIDGGRRLILRQNTLGSPSEGSPSQQETAEIDPARDQGRRDEDSGDRNEEEQQSQQDRERKHRIRKPGIMQQQVKQPGRHVRGSRRSRDLVYGWHSWRHNHGGRRADLAVVHAG